jgi:hypothetical protein
MRREGVMRIYVSGAYSRGRELKIVARRLAWLGHPCTSRWLDLKARTLADAAAVDAADVKEADLILRFSDPEVVDESNETIPRRLGSGARHTEVGMGLAWGKKIAVVGGHQNCFDHLEQVMHFATLEDFIEWLRVWES